MGVPKGGDFRTEGLPVWVEARKGSAVLALHVQPGARRTAVVGQHGDRLKVAVASPPSDGRANTALVEFLADLLALPRSSVTVVSGATSREKRIAVATDRPALSIAAALQPRGQ